MNWLTNAVLPKIQALVGREMPENLWHKCPSCGQMIFHRELEDNHRVCSECDHHMRLPPMERLKLLLDDEKIELIDLGKTLVDPLKFRDRKRYSERLKDAQHKTGRHDAILVAHGTLQGLPVVIAAFDFSFMGGSMGTGVGEGLVRAAKLAGAKNAALIVVPASGGARMQEGILSLMQMPRSVAAIERFKDTGRPFVVLLTDPTTGGVTASFAMLGDLHVAEPGAIIGFAGQRVIQETIREQLPEGFQKAEYLLEHGMVDAVVHRNALKETLGRMLGLLMRTEPVATPAPSPSEPAPNDGASAAPVAGSGDAAAPEAAQGDAATDASAVPAGSTPGSTPGSITETPKPTSTKLNER
jgi:acetyl-CoA carboxylase carboxyl transferase subunit beta